MQLKSLLSKMAGFIGARVIGAGLGFASQLVLTRMLPIEDVGVVLLGMSAAAFISLAANGGYALLATTQLPKMAARGQRSAVVEFNRVAVTDTLILYLLICGLAWLSVWLFQPAAGTQTALTIGILCAPASLLIRYNSSVAMAARAFKTAYVPDFLFRPAAFLLGLLAAAMTGWLHSALAALLVFVAITYAAALGQAWLLGADSVGIQHLRRGRPGFVRATRARSLPLFVVAAALLAFADITLLLSGSVLPARDVAVVGVALRLAALAGFVLQAAQSLVLTDLTHAWTTKDNATVEALLRRANLITFAIAIVGFVLAAIAGEAILALFGEDYRIGAELLLLFLLGQSLRALGGMNQQMLAIEGYQMKTAGACMFALLILFGLTVAFSQVWGMVGVGYAVVLSELAWMLALAVQAARLCGRRGDIAWVLLGR